MFRPQLVDILKGYNKATFYKDIIAGIIVGIVALPLAIAFAIASGVSPEKGLITAVIAGFIIAALGGSRVQIGGPTGAFIVIVFGIVTQYGVGGLIIATFLAGIMLVIMGIARLGAVIKFIPHPLIVGFTTGIAVIIFSAQMKDIFGLALAEVPAGFLEKWIAYGRYIFSTNLYALGMGIATILIVIVWPRVTRKIPGSLVAILVTTVAAYLLHLPVETIGSRFGAIPSSLPTPALPDINLSIIRDMIRPAFTIALLGGIESLLSAVVADGMTGKNHRSNTELIAQGVANIGSAAFGGIPATGAIARTATNIKNGGTTPIAGIVHAITLFVIMLFAGEWAGLIPMATLGGILIVVAYNMSEWKNFRSILRGSKSDAAVLLTTFFITVLVDLTVAIEIGMIMAAFLFMQQMMRFTSVHQPHLSTGAGKGKNRYQDYSLPDGVKVFVIKGPLFFGAAYKFKDAMQILEKPPRVLIIRMSHVPIIDATGIHILKEVHQALLEKGTRLILSEVTSPQVFEELKKARLLFAIGKANVTTGFEEAVKRSSILSARSHA